VSYSESVGISKAAGSLRMCSETNPQNILHKTYTGDFGNILSIYFNGLDKSKDLERVKGIEPSS
jgi:hypothetical protein